MKRLIPPVALFLLAPVIAELLSGSAPPVEFFRPIGLAVLTILYGGGAILVREITIRWKKGWLSLLVLGAAYGIIEEGLMVKSFFDPNWTDLGILATYGRWAGVNWVWSIELTLYHAVISIAIPISIAELIFSNRRNDAWVGRKGLTILSVLFIADVAFGYFLLTTYRPAAIPYFLTVVVVIALVLLAWRLPRQAFAPRAVIVRHPFWFWLTGFLGAVSFFLIFWGLPTTLLHPALTIIIGIGLMILIGWIVTRISGSGVAWTEIHRFALVAGPLTPFILLAPIHELDATRPDNTTGMTLVGLAMLVFLLWLWWWVRRNLAKAQIS
jgi:hypothetical protein